MSAILGIIGVTLLGLGAKGAVADQYTFTNPGITYTPFCNPYGSYCRPPEIVGRYTVTYGISDEHIGMLAGGGVLFALALILLGGTCVLRRKEKSNVINQNAHGECCSLMPQSFSSNHVEMKA